MSDLQGRIWYELAAFYNRNGEEEAKAKAYAYALRFDPNLPPLPEKEDYFWLLKVEKFCMIAIATLVWVLALYLVLLAPPLNPEFFWLILPEEHLPRLFPHSAGGEKDDDAMPVAVVSAPPTLSQYKPAFINIQLNKEYTILSNALYRFLLDQGQLPGTLEELVTRDYLEEIPAEPKSKSNRVANTYTTIGGWVYSPTDTGIHAEQVEKSLYPNVLPNPHHWFAPLTLEINKLRATITLRKGGVPIKIWPVSTGAPDTPTPEGNFYIIAKNELEADQRPTFGTRWMKLGQYYPNSISSKGSTDTLASRGIGIHGTGDPKTVGSSITHGCIRMLNQDVEELYQLIPNGTPVNVVFQ